MSAMNPCVAGTGNIAALPVDCAIDDGGIDMKSNAVSAPAKTAKALCNVRIMMFSPVILGGFGCPLHADSHAAKSP